MDSKNQFDSALKQKVNLIKSKIQLKEGNKTEDLIMRLAKK